MTNWEQLKTEAAGVVNQHLGEAIRYHYLKGDTASFCAVFEMVDSQVVMGGEVAIDSRAPSCTVRKCDLQRRPKHGDLVTRRDVTYEVRQCIEVLDTGFKLLLHAVDDRHAYAVRSKT
jgi:hypothetical protein